MFQSTHPHRVRHACKGSILFPYLCFNPRTHTGCDVSLAAPQFLNRRFQSTHPHGVRRMPSRPFLCPVSFNPRTHTGCDLLQNSAILRPLSFNPRTHTGCDLNVMLPCIVCMFQSTHPHGVRLRRRPPPPHTRACFNPRTHTGCDAAGLSRAQTATEFQSTHPHGVRLNFSTKKPLPCFNPRTHTGCDSNCKKIDR